MCRMCETDTSATCPVYRPPLWLIVATALVWWLIVEAVFCG